MPSTTAAAAAQPPKYGQPGGPMLSLDLNNPPPMTAPSAPILGAGDLALEKARIRGTNDAGANRAIAGTAARLGGDQSSPLFSLLAGMHQGGANAATATAGAELTYKNAKEGRDYGMQQLSMQLQKYMFDRQQQLAENSDQRAGGAFNIQQLLAQMELARARAAQPGTMATITNQSNEMVANPGGPPAGSTGSRSGFWNAGDHNPNDASRSGGSYGEQWARQAGR